MCCINIFIFLKQMNEWHIIFITHGPKDQVMEESFLSLLFVPWRNFRSLRLWETLRTIIIWIPLSHLYHPLLRLQKTFNLWFLSSNLSLLHVLIPRLFRLWYPWTRIGIWNLFLKPAVLEFNFQTLGPSNNCVIDEIITKTNGHNSVKSDFV